MKIFNWVQRKFHHNALKDEEYCRGDVNQKETSQELIMDGSILTIGTFGVHFHDQPTSYHGIEYEDEEKEEEKEFDSESEVNPLVFTTFTHNLDLTSLELDDGICCNSSDDSEYNYKKVIAERTTLADLFLADSQVNINLSSAVGEEAVLVTDKVGESKNSLLLAKKLIPQAKKLNQKLKRMTRRKIHPELKVPAQELKSMDESAYLLPIPEVNG